MRQSHHSLQFAVARLLSIAISGFLVAACDGVGWPAVRSADQSPAGVYNGSFTSTVTDPSPARQAIGFISEDFDGHFLLADQHYAGIVAVDGIALSGSLVEYRGRQGVFIGFDGRSTISLDGEVDQRAGASGTYAGENAAGRFGLTYNSVYEEGSSLDQLLGLTSYNESSSSGAVYTMTLQLDDNGELFGSDTSGCIFNGRLSIIDDRYSVYRAAVTVSACGEVDGDYNGLAFHAGTTAPDVLYLGTDSGQFAFRIALGRT